MLGTYHEFRIVYLIELIIHYMQIDMGNRYAY